MHDLVSAWLQVHDQGSVDLVIVTALEFEGVNRIRRRSFQASLRG